jgi:GWxTD domain-containing protein
MARSIRRCASLHLLVGALAAVLLSPGGARAIVRPLEARGDFAASIDIVDRWRDDATLDVVVLVEVANSDLAFDEVGGGSGARLRVEVELTSLDGEAVREVRTVQSPVLSAEDAASTTLRQRFGVVLEAVPFRAGRVSVSVFDEVGRKSGLVNLLQRAERVTAAAGAWAAHEGPRATAGIALEQPLFLAQAPLERWRASVLGGNDGEGRLYDYAQPSRRYGLEQDRLQIFLPVWPAAGGLPLDDQAPGLRVEVASLDLDFALTDTITFDNTGRAALAAGRPAGLFYELDVNLLPEGSFLLSLGPTDRRGRGAVVQFDVVWRLAALARRPDQVRGEGRTIFAGAELRSFLEASAAEQEARLQAYWDSVNPEPSSPVNEAQLEFQYRLAFVKQFLGGFGENGAEDPRGEVFLALGPPDGIKTEHMPMNFRDQDDARINVYQRFAPDREGSWARGNTSWADPSPYGSDDPIPQPYSHRAETQRVTSQQTAAHSFGFELWEYDNGGNSLWPNRFSASGMGQRFLFVDRTGSGDYFLESSNVIQGEE